jgi:hypothetical protein
MPSPGKASILLPKSRHRRTATPGVKPVWVSPKPHPEGRSILDVCKKTIQSGLFSNEPI